MVSLPNQLSCQTEVVVIYNETVESVDWTRVVLAVKSLPASVGDAREVSSIPGSGRSPEDGNGNPLQYSCLENFMDRGAWWAIVHGVEKSWAWQSDWTHTHTEWCLWQRPRGRVTLELCGLRAERLDSKVRKPKRNSGRSDPELGLHPITIKKKKKIFHLTPDIWLHH